MDGLVNDYLSEEAKKKLEVGLPPEEFLAIVREDLEQQGIFDDATNWMLVRKRDGLTKYSKDIKWVDGDKRELTDEIQVGRWLAMSPFNEFFTWKTFLIFNTLSTMRMIVRKFKFTYWALIVLGFTYI